MKNSIPLNLVGTLFIFFFTFHLFSQNGTTPWAYSFGGNSFDRAADVITDSNGNVFLLANIAETVDFNTGTGNNILTATGFMDSVIIKFNTDGTMLWIKQLSSSANSGIQATSFHFDSTGNLLVGGFFKGTVNLNPSEASYMVTSTNLSRYDGFVIKLTQNGDFIWGKQIESNHDLILTKLILDANDNIAATGYFRHTADFDPGVATYNLISNGESDIFVFKWDANGDFLWAKHAGASKSDVSYSIAADQNGNIITTGYFQRQVDFNPGTGSFVLDATSFTARRDMFVWKLNSLGEFVWAKQIGAESHITSSYAAPRSIALDTSGNIYTTGEFFVQADFDPGPSTHIIHNTGVMDIFICKLDTNGEFVWAKAFLSTSSGIGYDIELDDTGHVFTTGYFSETVDFDPGANTYNLTATDVYDLFVLKLTSVGDFVWAVGRGGENIDEGRAIDIDTHGNVFVAGEYWYNMDFGSGINYISNGYNDMFVMKLTQDPLSIDEISVSEIVIFPNPVSEKLYISSLQTFDTITLYDVNGRKVLETLKPQSSNTLDMTSLKAGLYFVKLYSGDTHYTYKLIKK